jgi:UDP-3-O-[3-hydroxymyristoyl] N-acetylglucosamine deacetylase
MHTGRQVHMRLAPREHGDILFRRTDLDGLEFEIDPRAMICRNSMVLLKGDQRIHTLEHLLATLYVYGIDSVLVELDAEEIPILDGSALALAQALEEAGTRPLPGKIEALKIQEKLVVEAGEARISVGPWDSFEIDYTIVFDHPLIGAQRLGLEIDPDAFKGEIAPARTFGFLKDVPELYARDLAQGGSFDNAVILDEKSVINGPLRFPDEFVRHKILDILGDFSLLGHPLFARVEAYKAGHSLHLKTVRYILEHPDVWILEEL